MRNRLVGLVSAVVLASTMATNGCKSTISSDGTGGTSGSASSGGKTGDGGRSTGGSNGSGGALGSGGSAGNSQPADASVCPSTTPCGGDLVGTWTVTSSCLNVTGDLNLKLAGAGCPSGPITGSLKVSGTWTANANETYTDNTVTSGEEQLTLEASCLVISSTPVDCDGAASLLASGLGFSKLDCPSAGSGCNCSAKVKQTGTLGFVSTAPSTSGNYKASGNIVTISGDSDDVQYEYCVSGNTLTMTPQSSHPAMTGAIILQKSNISSSGGATGSGGQIGSGGKSGSGGATGQVGSGGKSSAGGTTGQGGSGGKSDSGGITGGGGTSDTGGTTGGSTGPCDIYAAANTPCVAAHSVVRALYGTYNGKLYQVRRSDNTTKDILPLAAGGIADTAPEDTFCTGSTCVLTVVYDQSGNGNDLWYQGSTQVPASTSSSPAKATKDAVNVGGHKVYSVYISPGNCYWHDGSKSGMPTGAQPEGMYMVTSSRNANAGCCFDYGNSETDRSADGAGAMDSLNFSTTTAWGSGAGSGPWVMADLEYGLFAQGDNKKNSNDPTQSAPFVTAVLKNNGTTEYALKGGDATTGSLSTYYKGTLPGGWSPMKKQGALILGCGGDCCKPSGGANASSGIFFEGAIVAGYPTDAAETAIQANIVAAGYGK
jgi:non-reducing end alpha-L-arabinofuranosidase